MWGDISKGILGFTIGVVLCALIVVPIMYQATRALMDCKVFNDELYGTWQVGQSQFEELQTYFDYMSASFDGCVANYDEVVSILDSTNQYLSACYDDLNEIMAECHKGGD